MRILIDGYNLIRRIPELREADRRDLAQGRESLLEQLSQYRAGKQHRITVIFDGADAIHLGGGSEKVGGISVRYSARGRNADQEIMEACRTGQADLLVTADREITDAADRSGVTSISPDLFWDKVSEEMYRRFKGEENEVERGRGKGERGRKLSKAQRRDRGRIENL
ncbi:MAG: NYN domain-containing protein [bacterium]|nr:NYN domain-containing protein [bacterium]MDT8396329.1 NYN domain-containing protein [bacterium]